MTGCSRSILLVCTCGLLLLPPGGPARGRSLLAGLGRSLQDGYRTCRAGLADTACCVDLFAGTTPVAQLADLNVGGAVKLNLPSRNAWRRARAEGRQPRLLYLAGGVSNSLAFAGYNPLFGGWNASYAAPLHGGLGAGLFAGGPYTGFFVNTPFLLSLGGWVESKGRAPPGRPPPEPFAAITLTVPGLSRLGVSAGLRLWIFSPLLRPVVRPLARPAWWLHERRLRAQRWIGRRLRGLWRRGAGHGAAAASRAGPSRVGGRSRAWRWGRRPRRSRPPR
jgi:hypothetical protein